MTDRRPLRHYIRQERQARKFGIRVRLQCSPRLIHADGLFVGLGALETWDEPADPDDFADAGTAALGMIAQAGVSAA